MSSYRVRCISLVTMRRPFLGSLSIVFNLRPLPPIFSSVICAVRSPLISRFHRTMKLIELPVRDPERRDGRPEGPMYVPLYLVPSALMSAETGLLTTTSPRHCPDITRDGPRALPSNLHVTLKGRDPIFVVTEPSPDQRPSIDFKNPASSAKAGFKNSISVNPMAPMTEKFM